jgi:hypothetical protein
MGAYLSCLLFAFELQKKRLLAITGPCDLTRGWRRWASTAPECGLGAIEVRGISRHRRLAASSTTLSSISAR